MAEEKKQDNHPQPLPDPRPSIEGAAEFDEDIAKKAAKTLREAMKGKSMSTQSLNSWIK